MIMKQDGEVRKLLLMPPADGCCRICAVKHEPHEAHNAQSLFYRMRFKMRYGRDGTWADAVAHCTPQVQAVWRAGVNRLGATHGLGFTEPPPGVAPIAEPIDG